MSWNFKKVLLFVKEPGLYYGQIDLKSSIVLIEVVSLEEYSYLLLAVKEIQSFGKFMKDYLMIVVKAWFCTRISMRLFDSFF